MGCGRGALAPNTEGKFPFLGLGKQQGWCGVRSGLKSDQEGLGLRPCSRLSSCSLKGVLPA